eukprot:3664274-Lingulodinium_polyedra.AAC.2
MTGMRIKLVTRQTQFPIKYDLPPTAPHERGERVSMRTLNSFDLTVNAFFPDEVGSLRNIRPWTLSFINDLWRCETCIVEPSLSSAVHLGSGNE